jgi:hypothetical protein
MPSTTSIGLLTPLPTLPPESSKKYLLQLLSTNGNCELPCLWGIFPGRTEIGTLKQFESQFGDVDNPKGYSTNLMWNEDSSTLFFQTVEDTLGRTIIFEHRGMPEINYLLLQINIDHDRGLDKFLQFSNYELSAILSQYGEPTQILLGPWPDDPDRPNQWLPFNLVLFYPGEGFLIEYVLDRQEDAGYFIGCPSRIVGLNVVAWNPNNTRTIDDVVKQKTDMWGINGINLHTFFLSTLDSTNITVHDFYETYKAQKNQTCIKAPRIKWPYGYMTTITP